MNRREYCKHGQLNNEIAWCTQCTDAQIAALTERLRAVEAERDEARRNGEAAWAKNIEISMALGGHPGEPRSDMELLDAVFKELSALRAELARKDAALKVIAESDEWSGGLSNTSHQERARAALDAKAGGQ